MEIIRPSSEVEMIAEFLAAEFDSVRFSDELRLTMSELGVDEKIITSPDITSEHENMLRYRVLSEFRGYGADSELFERFPDVDEWSLCRFGTEDLPRIRYINYSYWDEISDGTHSPIGAAPVIRSGRKIFGQSTDGFIAAAAYIRGGGTFPKMFLLTADYGEFVIVEGHLRMTAYALAPECFHDIECIVGKCESGALLHWLGE